MDTKVSTGTAAMDWLLEGGYEKGVITTIYGPGGSGKSNLLLLFIANSKDYKKAMERITFLHPTTFKEQENAVTKLEGLVKQNIGAILVDSLTMLYRIEMDEEDNRTVNKALVLQMRTLLELARKNDIPVLVTSHVYADFEDKDKVNVVGGTIVKNMSKCLIELRKSGMNRVAVVHKHRSIEEGKKILFKIIDDGIVEVEEKPAINDLLGQDDNLYNKEGAKEPDGKKGRR
jgi:DNA repair protein RadB